MAKMRVLVWQEWHWFVAQCLDVDVASQGGSLEEALGNIREALLLHFEPPAASPIAFPQNAAAPEGALEVSVAL